jgi:3-hydroxyisobutyrate dehydrogenase-like beta-hydroxyacid dehydrogenase
MSLGSVNNLMFQFMLGTMLEGGPHQLDGLKFSLGNAAKDLDNYTALTKSLQLPSPVAAAVRGALSEARDMGLGDKFVASLILGASCVSRCTGRAKPHTTLRAISQHPLPRP